MLLEYMGQTKFSKCIRFFSVLRFWANKAKDYSHTSWSFAVVEDGYLIGDLSEWESWYKGVEHVELIGTNHSTGTRVDLYELRNPITEDEKKIGVEFLKKQEGKKYDWWGIFGLLFRVKTEETDKWFCCELILAFLRKINRTILQHIHPWQTVPGVLPMSPDFIPCGYIIVGRSIIYDMTGSPVAIKIHQEVENIVGYKGVLKHA